MPAKRECLDYALNYIYRYQKSKKELIIQLRKKWYVESEIEKTIKYLEKKWYVNDEKFIKDYIDYHIIRNWKPIITIKNKLYEKWLDTYLTKKIIEENFEEINKWIEKKLKEEIEKMKKKDINPMDIIQKLTRKWYTMNQVRYVINHK